MLPNLLLRQSWGVDTLERAFVLAALLLQQASPQCRLSPEEREIAVAASLPLTAQLAPGADLPAQVGVISTESAPEIAFFALPTPKGPGPLPVEPPTVTTVEAYLVWCAQQLGYTLRPGERLLVQGRVPYDRPLWLVTRNLIRSITTTSGSSCAIEGLALSLTGSGLAAIDAPVPVSTSIVGRGRLRAESIRASSSDLFGSADLASVAGVWLQAAVYGEGSLASVPPVGASGTLSGSGILTFLDEPFLAANGSGEASFVDGLTQIDSFGTGILDADPEFAPLWLPWIGGSRMGADMADPEAELEGTGIFRAVVPGEFLILSGAGLLKSDPLSWSEIEVDGAGFFSAELDLIALDFSGSALFEAEPETVITLFGLASFSGDPVVHAAVTALGVGVCDGVQFGDQGSDLFGFAAVKFSAALASNVLLEGFGYLLAQPEDVPSCRVPCGGVLEGELTLVELKLGEVELIV